MSKFIYIIFIATLVNGTTLYNEGNGENKSKYYSGKVGGKDKTIEDSCKKDNKLDGPIAPCVAEEKQSPQPKSERENFNEELLRMILPNLNLTKVGDIRRIELLPRMVRNIKTLSINPPIFEIENFLDEDECDLAIAISTSKGLQPIFNPSLPPLKMESVDLTFEDWDYDENGSIDIEEMSLAPGKSELYFNQSDAKDMFSNLSMDANEDGVVDREEFHNTDIEKLHEYLTSLKNDVKRFRNRSSQAAWIWHDDDELLRFNDEYFNGYHERLSKITGLPVSLIEESEPLQVQKHEESQFQICRQDSEPTIETIPCCLYGDTKQCRLCRYITLTMILNDVEEGGEISFPMATKKYDDIMMNSGEWRGYFNYDATSGSRQHFTMNLTFKYDGANRVVNGNGSDSEADFMLKNSLLIGNTLKFQKEYHLSDLKGSPVKYSGKIIGGTRIQGKWWIPNTDKFHGNFFMWFSPFERFTRKSMDQCYHETACASSGLRIKPKKGSAILSYNHAIDDKTSMIGELRQESMIGHCQVIKGVKWTATTWINIIGDGDHELRAWRRGYNYLTNKKKLQNDFASVATTLPKLSSEPFEEDFRIDMNLHHGNGTTPSQTQAKGRYKPASHVYNAIISLLNSLDKSQLVKITKTVHEKLHLTCIPLSVEENGRMQFVDGSRE